MWLAVLGGIVVVLVLLFAVLHVALRPKLCDGEAPAVSGWLPWVGAGVSMTQRPRQFYPELYAKHKNGCTLLAGGQAFCLLTSPAGVNAFYKAAAEELRSVVVVGGGGGVR
jgi:hypothetical protein